MIQRKQTLWLLLALVASVLTFMFPFATGEEAVKENMKQSAEITAGSNFIILILTIASLGIAAVTIFMFKDRKMQMRLCLLGLLVSAGIFVLYILEMNKLVTSTPALWAIVPLIPPVCYFLAFKGIRTDEKLVKSLDKLR